MSSRLGPVFDRRVLTPVDASFESLLEAAPDAMVGVDETGLIRFVNRQTELLFGYHRDELVGLPIETLVPEAFRAVHPQHRGEYFAHPATRAMGAGLALSGRRKDGSEFPVDISLSSIETEHGALVTAAVRDITERQKVDAKFEGLLEAAPDAMVGVDRSGVIRFVNRQVELIFGYTREELVGQPIETLVPESYRDVHPEHRKGYFVHCRRSRPSTGRWSPPRCATSPTGAGPSRTCTGWRPSSSRRTTPS